MVAVKRVVGFSRAVAVMQESTHQIIIIIAIHAQQGDGAVAELHHALCVGQENTPQAQELLVQARVLIVLLENTQTSELPYVLIVLLENTPQTPELLAQARVLIVLQVHTPQRLEPLACSRVKIVLQVHTTQIQGLLAWSRVLSVLQAHTLQI